MVDVVEHGGGLNSFQRVSYLFNHLLKNTPSQQELIEFQEKICDGQLSTDIDSNFLGKLSRSYYYAFIQQNKEPIETNKARKFELARQK